MVDVSPPKEYDGSDIRERGLSYEEHKWRGSSPPNRERDLLEAFPPVSFSTSRRRVGICG
jgi:hypothetical protein